jgi:2-isopropylmalate synthase
MARAIEFLDTTLRDGNKLPFVALSPDDRVVLAARLERLGVDIIEAGSPAASGEDAECLERVARAVRSSWVSALARALPDDAEKALKSLREAAKPYLHLFMPVSAEALASAVKLKEIDAVRSVRDSLRVAKDAGVRAQFSLSEVSGARGELRDELCRAAREEGADVISFADTGGGLLPEDVESLVTGCLSLFPRGKAPLVGVHCHNDLGLATANTLAAIKAGAGHVEVTLGGFGERAGNAALEEIAFIIAAHGPRLGITHGISLDGISAASEAFDALTGVHTHPNKPVIGRSALSRARGSPAWRSMDPRMRELFSEKTIGAGGGADLARPEDEAGPYTLKSFNVLTGSHAPPVGIVVIGCGGSSVTQSSHGSGPIDALFKAVDRAVGFSPKLAYYSLYTLATGHDAPAEVAVTVELKGRRFHGRYRSTDVIEASLRAYLLACNAVGKSGTADGRSDFYVQGEYLWE